MRDLLTKIRIRNAFFVAVTGCLMLTCFLRPVNAATSISSVNYAHSAIVVLKNITVPINQAVTGENIHTMRYLMRQIDKANEIINGEPTTDYENDPKWAVINAVTAERAVAEIKDKIKLNGFSVHLDNVSSFDFRISAAGNYTIDWGDGPVQFLVKPSAGIQTISHSYATPGDYVVTIKGKATAYSTDINIAAITFNLSAQKAKIKGISGSLGQTFSTLPNGTNPRFVQTFDSCTELVSEIPPELFSGITGQPAARMFSHLFNQCNKITGSIPPGLFSGLSGTPTQDMFRHTFAYCHNITGTIPPGLFAGIAGAPATYMFSATFYETKKITGTIPPGIFAGISGAPQPVMYAYTFNGMLELTGTIPPNLFGNIVGPYQSQMYWLTFSGSPNLSGTIPPGLFGNIYGTPASGAFDATFSGLKKLTGTIPPGLFGTPSGKPASQMFRRTFFDCIGLTGSIPSGLFGTLSGTPASEMFKSTFWNCPGLTGPIPSGLFGNLSGAPASEMFNSTFYGCNGLTGSIPAGLFGTLSGTPASHMFSATFRGTSNLTGPIPANLFGTFSGNPANNMFYQTFYGANKLSGVTNAMWDLSGLNNTAATDAFGGMFYNTAGMTGLSPAVSLSDQRRIWTAFSPMGSGTFASSGFSDFASIPAGWR